MIGKPEWFGRRKYTGWGLSPRTWQGWAYLLLLIVPIVVVQSAAIGGNFKLVITIAWAAIFALDFIDIMRHLPKDERDRAHEAIAERNALWVMLAVLVVGVGYEAAVSAATQKFAVDPVIIFALLAATIAKGVTNAYLDKKN